MSLSYKDFFQKKNNDKITIFKKIFLKRYITDVNMYNYICSFIFYDQEEMFEVYCASLTNVISDINSINYVVTNELHDTVKICVYSNYPGIYIQFQTLCCKKCGEIIMASTNNKNRCTC